MKILPKKGFENLRFGMTKKQVEQLTGKPNKHFKDEDGNDIFVYNSQKMVLNFYADEGFKLGYLTVAAPEVLVHESLIIGKTVDEAKALFTDFKKWEFEDFDTFEHYFNEDNWLVLVCEFGKITKIEIGAIIKNDEFVWAV
jgi:hypothetical protein